MNLIDNPSPAQWPALTQRPAIPRANLESDVRTIMEAVRREGDAAVLRYTAQFDRAQLDASAVPAQAFADAKTAVSPELRAAISLARDNITRFHRPAAAVEATETTPGVRCWARKVAIERVGLYIPGGTAPLFSTLLMLGVPALQAGCREIVVCTPPAPDGSVHPAILYTAELLGLKRVYRVGGVQAVAAMTFGTAEVPRVDKIFGPGNQYVTCAKELAQGFGVAIDMPAGPSEVLVIADESAEPEFVAADLLSQAEHGADSQVMLLSDSAAVLAECLAAVERQLEALPRREMAAGAIQNSKAVLLPDLKACMAFSNAYAPEHLILALGDAEDWAGAVTNAGSVFLGNYSCESAGDYASGTNHTLPTNGFARNYSGVSVDSFCKRITFQQLSATGIRNLGPAIEVMAEAEGLFAHKNAVTIRLNALQNT
ncbi:MAG: histidinol dehydrogenase [Bacteroidota bacterium]